MILGVLLKKELLQLKRNVFLPKLLIAFPILVMLVMPWVMQMDVKNIRLTVVDQDHSSLSQRLQSHLSASDYFMVADPYPDYTLASAAMDRDEVDVIVSIPRHFEKNLLIGNVRPILVEANGVNAMKGQMGLQYVMQSLRSTLSEIQMEQGLPSQEVELQIQNRYNETSNAMHYMLPAIMIIVILLVCGFLPSLSIVMEKEDGTIEMMNVTPIKPMDFILAKLIPYMIAGELIFLEAMLFTGWIYGLWPIQGWASLWAIVPASLLFIIVMSAFSLCIANVSSTLQQAVLLMFFFLMNFMLLSGILTPIASMPEGFRYITYVLPPRYFIEIMRSVYLKGTSIAEQWPNYVALLGIALFFILLAIKTYHKQN